MDFLYIRDKLLEPSQCQKLINKFKSKTKKNYHKGGNYFFHDFDLKPLEKEINTLIQEYRQLHPVIDLTYDRWRFTRMRFKHFPAEHSFAHWHVDHGMIHSLRIVGILIYLSSHKTGTEFFMNKEHIISQIGRAIMFPTSFTHAHRGHLCPDKKDRYILTTYGTLSRE